MSLLSECAHVIDTETSRHTDTPKVKTSQTSSIESDRNSVSVSVTAPQLT